jgi:hypothetical protein
MSLNLEAKFRNSFGVSAAPALEAIALSEIDLQNDNRSSVFQMQSMDREIDQWNKISGLNRFKLTAEGEQAMDDNFQDLGLKTYTAIKFALEIGITEEMIDDARFDLISRMVRELASAGTETQMFNAWNLFNNSFSTETAYDGISLISASHPSPVGNQSNLLTAADLDISSLKAGYTRMRRIVDDKNKRLNVMPEKLVVSVDDEHNAVELVSSPFLPGGSTNNINSVKRYEVVSSPYLTDADAWWLVAGTSSKAHGLKIKDRMPLSRELHADNRTGVMYYISKFRQAIGADEWRGVFGNAGA